MYALTNSSTFFDVYTEQSLLRHSIDCCSSPSHPSHCLPVSIPTLLFSHSCLCVFVFLPRIFVPLNISRTPSLSLPRHPAPHCSTGLILLLVVHSRVQRIRFFFSDIALVDSLAEPNPVPFAFAFLCVHFLFICFFFVFSLASFAFVCEARTHPLLPTAVSRRSQLFVCRSFVCNSSVEVFLSFSLFVFVGSVWCVGLSRRCTVLFVSGWFSPPLPNSLLRYLPIYLSIYVFFCWCTCVLVRCLLCKERERERRRHA